jgi:hypothetical protein
MGSSHVEWLAGRAHSSTGNALCSVWRWSIGSLAMMWVLAICLFPLAAISQASETIALQETQGVPSTTQSDVQMESSSDVGIPSAEIATPPANEAADNPLEDTASKLFSEKRFWSLILVLAVCFSVLICTFRARMGAKVYVRPIAGLKAIEEAVGRATEMGRPVLFVPGIMDLNELQTVAGLSVLSSVAKESAAYENNVHVPTARSLVMTAAREVVQAACIEAGKPDVYNDDSVRYITDEQFAYVAEVCGWTQREKPAACFYMGQFFAESLLLAENGNSVGAIQIAGTAESSQLPFFVASCDYTLLGEELFAASAYLSGEPQQLGSLQGQDLGKALAVTLLLVGCLLITLVQFKELGPYPQIAYDVLYHQILGRD